MKYIYRAKDKQGNIKTGRVEARSLDVHKYSSRLWLNSC